MNRQFVQFQQMLFLVLDLFLLNLIYLFTQSMIVEREGDYNASHTFYWVLLNITWVVFSFLGEIYAQRRLSNVATFTRYSFQVYFIWVFFVLVISFALRGQFTISREFVYTDILVYAGALLFNRFLYILIRVWVKERGELTRRVMILGYNPVSRKLARYLEREEFNVQIVGFIEDPRRVKELSNYPVYPDVSRTIEIAKRNRVTDLYSTIMPENNSVVYNLMEQADKELIRFRIVPDFSFFVNRPVHIDYLNDLPILSPRREPLLHVLNRFKKRSFDIAVSLFVTLFILSWLIPLLGIIIYLQSPGPIFFVQLRSGLNNRPFRCFKFRSMKVNKDANSKQATKGDSRVTKIGRIMRKTSLDEFPQFLNVLMGDMSIVGPRPHMLRHTKDYSQLEEQYMIRQFLKPGITGWAQVNGYRGEITELKHIQKRVEYDLWYLENWSLWLDIKIIFLTVYNVFRGEENAY